MKLYYVNSLLCEHAKVTEVVNYIIGVNNSSLGHGSLPTNLYKRMHVSGSNAVWQLVCTFHLLVFFFGSDLIKTPHLRGSSIELADLYHHRLIQWLFLWQIPQLFGPWPSQHLQKHNMSFSPFYLMLTSQSMLTACVTIGMSVLCDTVLHLIIRTTETMVQ